MATLFGSLPAAGSQSRSGSGSSALIAAGSGGERALQWVYDEETSNCMHCNTPFTLLTRKVIMNNIWIYGAVCTDIRVCILTLLLCVYMCCSTTAGDAGT